MELWGVTGLMGAGKSSAIRYLASRGFPTVDADVAAREVVDPSHPSGRAAVQQIAREFGSEVLGSNGELDRRKLRNLMAASPANRDRLERLLHPLILARLEEQARAWEQAGVKLGFIEGSRLVESGFVARLAGCILVTAPENERLARVIARDGGQPSEALAVFRLQDEARLRKTCSMIWNNVGSEAELQAQVDAFLRGRGIV